MKGAVTRIEREMGYSATEFAAVLPAAMRDWPVEGGPDEWRIAKGSGEVIARIRIDRQADRRIGALRLPVLVVTVEMADVPKVLAEEFLRRFERGFHRGGG